MEILTQWYRRIAAFVMGAILGVLVPAVAWAQTDETAVAVGDNLAKVKAGKAIGGVAVFAVLCCLVVVAIIVVVVMMIVKRRR